MNNTKFVIDLLNNGFRFGKNKLLKKNDIVHVTNTVDTQVDNLSEISIKRREKTMAYSKK